MHIEKTPFPVRLAVLHGRLRVPRSGGHEPGPVGVVNGHPLNKPLFGADQLETPNLQGVSWFWGRL